MIDPSTIRGVIFDLDGTLYHMRWFMRPLLTLQLLPRLLLVPRYMAVRKKFSGRDLQSGEQLLKAMAVELSRKSIGLSESQAYRWISHSFYTAFVNVMRLMRGHRRGLADTLAGLRSRSIECAVLSDFAYIDERLDMLGIDRAHFSIRLAAESAGSLKPGARPFLQIAGSWKIEPAGIVVIGDRDDTDGEAARAAGMQFVRITDRKREPTAEALRWEDVREWLERLGQNKDC
jgi:FMN phosphatase YigB (HAD superfamily)